MMDKQTSEAPMQDRRPKHQMNSNHNICRIPADGKTKTFKQKAFTLVELLIVISVIGILYGISTPVIGTIKATAQTRRKASIDNMVAQAKIRYVNENEVTVGQVPTFAQLAQYMAVNGVVPATASTLTDGALNGVGQTITAYGTYPNPTTGAVTPLTWGTLGAPPAN